MLGIDQGPMGRGRDQWQYYPRQLFCGIGIGIGIGIVRSLQIPI